MVHPVFYLWLSWLFLLFFAVLNIVSGAISFILVLQRPGNAGLVFMFSHVVVSVSSTSVLGIVPLVCHAPWRFRGRRSGAASVYNAHVVVSAFALAFDIYGVIVPAIVVGIAATDSRVIEMILQAICWGLFMITFVPFSAISVYGCHKILPRGVDPAFARSKRISQWSSLQGCCCNGGDKEDDTLLAINDEQWLSREEQDVLRMAETVGGDRLRTSSGGMTENLLDRSLKSYGATRVDESAEMGLTQENPPQSMRNEATHQFGISAAVQRFSATLFDMVIRAILVINTHGKLRLSKFYEELSMTEKKDRIFQTFRAVHQRDTNACNFLDGDRVWGEGTKIIYRHYATLYFVFVADESESELGILDLIRVFVETLDKCFENVCELDLIFHSDKVHHVVDEIVTGGMVLETNKDLIFRAIEAQAKMERTSQRTRQKAHVIRDRKHG